MLKTLDSYGKALLHLFFPHYCEGCGSDVLGEDRLLCLECLAKLPDTGFFHSPANPVEKTFYGRLPVVSAGTAYYFTKDSLVQHLVTLLKYDGHREMGVYLGVLTGMAISASDRFTGIDCIVPLPLNPKRLQKRGYNQAALIAEGIASICNVPVLYDAVERKLFTETQTKKDRVHRWQSMQQVFAVKNASVLQDKHVLLVDDIITTGATLEACGATMVNIPGLKLSIATVAWTI